MGRAEVEAQVGRLQARCAQMEELKGQLAGASRWAAEMEAAVAAGKAEVASLQERVAQAEVRLLFSTCLASASPYEPANYWCSSSGRAGSGHFKLAHNCTIHRLLPPWGRSSGLLDSSAVNPSMHLTRKVLWACRSGVVPCTLATVRATCQTSCEMVVPVLVSPMCVCSVCSQGCCQAVVAICVQATTAEGAARLAAAEERLQALKATADVADSESGSEEARIAELEEAAARLPQLEALAAGVPELEHRAARVTELEAANAELRAAKVSVPSTMGR